MFNSIVLNIKKQKFVLYSQAFNFFQSKPINMVVNSRKLDYVVHFRDLQFYDDETEYLKRSYIQHEALSRIKRLTSYYENNMTPPTPNLLTLQNYHILDNRNRKIIKLCIMKEKSLERKQDHQEESTSNNNMILSQLDHSNLSRASSQEKEDDDHQQSFDTEPHDAFDFHFEDQEIQNKLIKKELQSKFKSKEKIGLTSFIFDFKIVEEKAKDPQIRIIPPLVPINSIMINASVQTTQSNSFQFAPLPKKTQKEKLILSPPMVDQKISGNIASPTQLSTSKSLKNEIKNENIMYAESIEIKKEEKKKPSTFMEYYNSVPVKSSSNILQKYIKRKK